MPISGWQYPILLDHDYFCNGNHANIVINFELWTGLLISSTEIDSRITLSYDSFLMLGWNSVGICWQSSNLTPLSRDIEMTSEPLHPRPFEQISKADVRRAPFEETWSFKSGNSFFNSGIVNRKLCIPKSQSLFAFE